MYGECDFAMTRSSPAVLRAAAILDYIAEHPGQSFTMADLVRALKLSQSTCHSLLAALVQVGYLYKTGEKAYALGSGLVNIGRQAEHRSSLLEIARPELRRLANSFDLISSALVVREGQCIVRERSASASQLGFVTRVGTTLRFRAPLAAVFFATAPDAAEAWLAAFSSDSQVIAEERKAFHEGVYFFKKYGFLALLANDNNNREVTSLEQSFDAPLNEMPVKYVESIHKDYVYELSSIVAPVYNETGAVDFIVSLFGYREPVRGAGVLALGQELRKACDHISAFALEPNRQAPISPV